MARIGTGQIAVRALDMALLTKNLNNFLRKP